MDLKDTYNKIAEDWFKDHNSDSWWKEEADHLISLLPAHAIVLDIGCGAGQKTRYLVDKGFRVTGADFSEKMIEIAQQQVPEATFKILDLYEADSLSAQFDCVFAQAVFLHIPKKDVHNIFEKIKKILKKDGLFYLAVKEVWPHNPDEEILEENDYGYVYKRFFSYFTLPELQGFLRGAGYTIVHECISSVGKTNWIQIIAKV